MILTNILSYFKRVTNNEEIQLLCFTEAAQRYLKTTGTRDQRSHAAIRICLNVHSALADEVETPWSESLALKVGTLTEKYREVVELHIDGNTFDEMATTLGISAKTTEARYKRALRMLAA
jgi:DNA-directed RNA polymerase specialized sigma24 family protein